MVFWKNTVQVNTHSAEELVRCFLGRQPNLKGTAEPDLVTEEEGDVIIGTWRKDTSRVEALSLKDMEAFIPWVYHEPESYLLKRVIYKLLSGVTGKRLPWGILTGIRPGKIVDHWLSIGISAEESVTLLQDVYLLREDKAQLLVSIALRQEPYRREVDLTQFNLYLHIPFCPTRCHYCSFPAVSIDQYRDYTAQYVDCLIKELHLMVDYFGKENIYTVYVGGGTPTALPDDDFGRLMDALKRLHLSDDIEVTIEGGRPETITEEKLKLMAPVINRLSINTQTSNDETLKAMGRCHTFQDVKDAFNRARAYEIPVINTDLILGLPGESEGDMLKSLGDVMDLEPENVTVHTLAIKKNSALDSQGGIKEMSLQKIVQKTMDFCHRAGYHPYYLYRQKFMVEQLENVGYAKAGYENRYNMAMMEEWNHTVGLGMGAVSKIFYKENHFDRFPNYKDLLLYCNSFDQQMKKKKNFLDKVFDHH